MQTVTLTGKKELDIYINPQRQRLMRELRLAGTAMTPKQLSVVLGISAAAVQHHIAKLVSLGVVGLSHTASIRGITAHYYQALPVNIRIGYGVADESNSQRLALIQNGVNAVLDGFAHYAQQHSQTQGSLPPGDVLWGVARLTQDEAQQLTALIRAFLDEHEAPQAAGAPWEYALIAYPAKEESHA